MLEQDVISFINNSVTLLRESMSTNKKLASSLAEANVVIKNQKDEIKSLKEDVALSKISFSKTSSCVNKSQSTLLTSKQANEVAGKLHTAGIIDKSLINDTAVKLACDRNYLFNTISFLADSASASSYETEVYGSLVKEATINISNTNNFNSTNTQQDTYSDPKAENEAFLRRIGCLNDDE